jgi:hypothetical protein
MSFASRSVGVHLARGAVGAGAFAAAIVLGPAQPFVAVAALVVALVALRGCPMCWTLGLIETVYARATGRTARPSCFNGACEIPWSAERVER